MDHDVLAFRSYSYRYSLFLHQRESSNDYQQPLFMNVYIPIKNENATLQYFIFVTKHLLHWLASFCR